MSPECRELRPVRPDGNASANPLGEFLNMLPQHSRLSATLSRVPQTDAAIKFIGENRGAVGARGDHNYVALKVRFSVAIF